MIFDPLILRDLRRGGVKSHRIGACARAAPGGPAPRRGGGPAGGRPSGIARRRTAARRQPAIRCGRWCRTRLEGTPRDAAAPTPERLMTFRVSLNDLVFD